MIKFLDLHAQYLSIQGEIDQAIAAVIEDTAFIGGPYAKRFEEQFAHWLGARHCIGVGNGTDALEICLEALDLPDNSDIIVPGNSFISTAEAVSRLGHKPVFCDVDQGHYTLTKEHVQKALTPKTKAIMAVHLYGHPCDMDALTELAQEHDLKIIEDCAQAHGAHYKGKPVGTLGDMGTFSFYPGKNLGAYGDAGAIVTQDEHLARKARMIANHGRIAKYDHEFEGRNSRLDGLQGAILSAKLPYLEDWTNQRIALADHYLNGLADLEDLILPVRAPWARQVYHLFVIRTDQRDGLRDTLTDQDIQTGIHYPVALPRLKAYAYCGQAHENMFVNRADSTLLSLPIGEHMSLQDADIVITAIRAFFRTS